MERVDVEGLRIAYERAGSGPPVALVHGFVGDGLSTWGDQIEALSPEFTVLAWDAPGAGGSSGPPPGFRAGEYADCLVAFLRALGFVHAHLVGLSFGGIVTLAVAERHPEVPRSLGLLGAYAGWRGSLPHQEVDARLAQCLELSELPAEDFARAMVPSMFSANAGAAAVAGFATSVRRLDPAGFRTMARASAESDLRHVLPGISVPTLLVYGDQDVRAPLYVAEALRSAIPAARLVVLPGVGHVSCVEAPGAVNRALGTFLRSLETDHGD
ncbi:MAG: alpha/beta hydrolase [Nocardioides sp.]